MRNKLTYSVLMLSQDYADAINSSYTPNLYDGSCDEVFFFFLPIAGLFLSVWTTNIGYIFVTVVNGKKSVEITVKRPVH